MSTSLKQAIDAAKARVSAAFDAVVAKGGTKPSVANLAALPSAIDSIPSGGGGKASPTSVSFEGYDGDGDTITQCISFDRVTTLQSSFKDTSAAVGKLVIDAKGRVISFYTAFWRGGYDEVVIKNAIISNIDWLFYDAKTKKISLENIDTSNCTSLYRLFGGCFATEIEGINNIDVSRVTNFTQAFQSLQIRVLDISSWNLNHISSFTPFANNINKVEEIIVGSGFTASFDISGCGNMYRENIVRFFNLLPTITRGSVISLGVLMGRITDEDKMIATSKGWTLA